MNIRDIIVISLLFLIGSVHAKTIQVGGDKINSYEQPSRCWNAAIQPVVFINGLQSGLQRNGNVAVALGISANNCGTPCEVNNPAEVALPSSEPLVANAENNQPVMVWYKDPKTNHSIIVNGRANHRDDGGNIQWQQLQAENGTCVTDQNRAVNNPCDCVLPIVPVYGHIAK